MSHDPHDADAASLAAYVAQIADDAAKIAATAPGLPHPAFRQLASHILTHLAGYKYSRRPWVPQDEDYLARILQATAEATR